MRLLHEQGFVPVEATRYLFFFPRLFGPLRLLERLEIEPVVRREPTRAMAHGQRPERREGDIGEARGQGEPPRGHGPRPRTVAIARDERGQDDGGIALGQALVAHHVELVRNRESE